VKFDNPELIIDRIIDKVGKDLVVGTPLALGKPNHLINALYKRVRNNPDLNLKIFTALTLDKPKGKACSKSASLSRWSSVFSVTTRTWITNRIGRQVHCRPMS
jgi:hypothetical protein